jgi:hypothetical protein
MKLSLFLLLAGFSGLSFGKSSEFNDSLAVKRDSSFKSVFQIGIEGGTIWDYEYVNNYFYGYYGAYINIDLHKKVIFLKLDGGKFFRFKGNESGAYFTIGIESKVWKLNRSNLLCSGGIGIIGGPGGAGVVFPLSVKYLYEVSDSFSVTGSLKLPVFPIVFFPEAGIGIQLNINQ